MDVRYSDAIRQNPAVFERLRPFAAQLERVVGPKSSPGVRAEWDTTYDEAGREVYRLSLADQADRASVEFTPADLAIPLYMRVSLSQVWGDLLKIQSDVLHEKNRLMLAEYLQQGEAGGGDAK